MKKKIISKIIKKIIIIISKIENNEIMKIMASKK